jgi:hypothetical protein
MSVGLSLSLSLCVGLGLGLLMQCVLELPREIVGLQLRVQLLIQAHVGLRLTFIMVALRLVMVLCPSTLGLILESSLLYLSLIMKLDLLLGVMLVVVLLGLLCIGGLITRILMPMFVAMHVGLPNLLHRLLSLLQMTLMLLFPLGLSMRRDHRRKIPR